MQHEEKVMNIAKNGDKIAFPIPKYSSNIVKLIDGNRSINEIIEMAYHDLSDLQQSEENDSPIEKQDLFKLFNLLYEIFNNCNWCLLKRPGIEISPTIHKIQSAINERHEQNIKQESKKLLDDYIAADAMDFSNV